MLHDEPGGVSPLLKAKYEGKNDVAEALARERGDGRLDVFEATTMGRIERLTALLEEDASRARAVSSDGFTALHLAAFFAQPACATLLLARGADPNAVAANAMKVTPLHSAAAARQLAIARALLAKGADANAAQHGGWTALHAAASHGDDALVALLLERGATPSLANDDGMTPLALAESKGHTAIASTLRAAIAAAP
jgi:ankyrin repeat protein